MPQEVWVAMVDGKLKSGILGIFTSSKAALKCVDRCKELFPDRIAWAEYARIDDNPTDFYMEYLTRIIDNYGDDTDCEYEEED